MDALFGMSIGLDQGLAWITLAVFTTLAPSGACSFILIALLLLRTDLSDRQRALLQKLTIVPIAIGLVGFIASTTHLGTPSNALYTLLGLPSSPLSREVLASAAYFGCAFVYWYLGFGLKPWMKRIQNYALGAAAVAAAAQLLAIATSYSIETIQTWSTVYVPLNLLLAALMGGSVVTVLAASCAGLGTDRTVNLRLLALAAAATVAAAVSQLAQNADLAAMESVWAYGAYDALVPWYEAAIAASFLLAAAAVAVDAYAVVRLRRLRPRHAVAACILMFLGIFAVRFAFYCMHGTVGL